MEEFNDLNDFQDNSMDIEPSVINDMDDILPDPISPEVVDIDVPEPEEPTLGEVGHCGNMCYSNTGYEHNRFSCGWTH